MRLPLLSIREGAPSAWTPTTFKEIGKNEQYLEKLIGKAPSLLGLEDLRTHVKGPYAAFHQLRVQTPTGGAVLPDIVFLTDSGHVVVVEVKLAGNDELKGRAVVAQLIEYAGSIAKYPEPELTELFDDGLGEGARFSDVVRRHLPGATDPEALAAELVRKIKAAEIHLVIACDRAPEGLRDLVTSVTAQQSLGNYELRVCELVPYVRPDGSADEGVLLVPGATMRTEVVARTVVEVKAGADGQPTVTASTTPQDEVQANLAAATGVATRPTNPQILAAVAAYQRMAEPGTSPVGRAQGYRFITVDGWPGDCHYEFLHRVRRRELGAELHFESDKVLPLANAVRDAKLQPTPELPGLAWDQTWSTGRGRLRVVFREDADPEVVARAMVALIRKTRGIVDGALRR